MAMLPDNGAVGMGQAVEPKLSGRGMPSGDEIMAEREAMAPPPEDENSIKDNPVVEGLRAVTQFAVQLKEQGAPNAAAVTEALTALMSALGGGAEPAPKDAMNKPPEGAFDPFAPKAPKGAQEVPVQSNDNMNNEAIPLT
jgi:hypothetical protein